jgi:uncharacterized protein involved in exopolysaccharide biosynthesis
MSTQLSDLPPDSALRSEVQAVVVRFRVLAARHWRTFVLVFLLSAAAIQTMAFVWPGTFEARAAVLLQKTRISTGVDADPSAPTTVMTDTVSQEEVNSEVAILTSREVLDATMRAAGLDQIPMPLYLRILFAPLRAYEWAYSWLHETPYPNAEQRARAGLANAISVERLRESNILVVSYRAGDPRFAEIVLNELLKQYLDRHVAVHSTMDVQPFFTTQSEVLRGEVTSLQAQLTELKAAAGVADFAVERDLQMRRAASLREEDLLVRRQIAELDGKLAAVRRSVSSDERWTRTSTTTRPASQAGEGLRAEILRLELQQIGLEAKFTDASPLVQENRAKLAAAQKALEQEREARAEESTTGLNPTLVALREEEARLAAERDGAGRRLAVLQDQLETARDRVTLLDEKAAEAERVQLQLESAKSRYLMYLERTERARMDAALDRSRVANVSIVQQADAPLKPVRPKRLMTLVVSVLGGLAIALLVCAWRELAAMGVVEVVHAAAPRAEGDA